MRTMTKIDVNRIMGSALHNKSCCIDNAAFMYSETTVNNETRHTMSTDIVPSIHQRDCSYKFH